MKQNCTHKMRVLLKTICALSLRITFILTCTVACHAVEKQRNFLPVKGKAAVEQQVVHASPVLVALEVCRLLPTDLNRIVCAYDIRPGIFIPFFQKKTSGYHDPRMERDDDRLEVQLFGIQHNAFLPVTHRCTLFTEQDPEDDTHISWDKEQIADDFRQAFPKARETGRGYVGVFKSPFDKPNPHPMCPQVSYNVVSMIGFFCGVSAKALHCNTQAVQLGQQISRLYLPPGVSVRDFVQSIDTYIAVLQGLREKAPFKKLENIEYMWGGMLDKNLDAYERIAPAIKEVLADKTGTLMPVFWDGGLLEDHVSRVRKKRKIAAEPRL